MLFTLLLLLVVGLPTAFVVNALIARIRGGKERGYPHATDGGEPTIYRRPTAETGPRESSA